MVVRCVIINCVRAGVCSWMFIRVWYASLAELYFLVRLEAVSLAIVFSKEVISILKRFHFVVGSGSSWIVIGGWVLFIL